MLEHTIMYEIALKDGVIENVPTLNDWKTNTNELITIWDFYLEQVEKYKDDPVIYNVYVNDDFFKYMNEMYNEYKNKII